MQWTKIVVLAGLLATALAGCGGGEPERTTRASPAGLGSCVDAWNRPANFEPGTPGRHVRRLGPTPAVPLFAHISRDKAGRCVVFLDTPSTVDDRRYRQASGRYSQVCAGDCGQDVKPGARTFQFRRDGTLPPL
jgi:hypothetical protein